MMVFRSNRTHTRTFPRRQTWTCYYVTIALDSRERSYLNSEVHSTVVLIYSNSTAINDP